MTVRCHCHRNPTVYDGRSVTARLQQRFSVDVYGTLVIRDVTLEDAGNFSCYDQSNAPDTVVLLIVLSRMSPHFLPSNQKTQFQKYWSTQDVTIIHIFISPRRQQHTDTN